MEIKKVIKGMRKAGASSDELRQRVKELVAEGVGRPTIAKTLDISEYKANKYMKEVKFLFESESPRPKVDVDQIPQEVKFLLAQGLDEIQIAQELNITLNSAVYWVKKVSSGNTKYNKVDTVRGLLDAGYQSYDVAKALNTAPPMVQKLIKRAENDFNPLQTWIQRMAVNGVKLSAMETQLGCKTLAKAIEIIKENFPECYVSVIKKGEETILMPVFNSSGDVEWLQKPDKEKKFKYYVSPEGNYMHVKFDDDLPEDTIEIYNITDIHFGSKGHVGQLFDDLIDIIENNPNAFFLVGGDCVEAATKLSVGDPGDQYITYNEQCLGAAKKLKRIAHKGLNWVYSNHDDGRAEKHVQIRPGEFMANMIGVPYFRGQSLIDIEWKGVKKTIIHAHNLGRAFEESAIVLAAQKVCAQYGDTHINAVMLGHSHLGFKRHIDWLGRDTGKGVNQLRTYVCNAGSTMSRTMTYAERGGYPPRVQDLIYWSFREDGKDWGTAVEVQVG